MQLFLKNCTICDGSGDRLYKSGILTEDKIIKAITNQIPSDFTGEVIDCRDNLVTPGFIDCHSHNDWFALSPERDIYFKTFIEQGITTYVTGNCGFSAAGYDKSSPFISDIGGGLFYLDEPTKRTASLSEWFDAIEQNSIVNIAGLEGHGTARISVNGKKSTALSSKQESDMLNSIETALKQGACGVSLGLMYEPGMYAPFDELKKVAELCVKHDKVLTVHPRAESSISLSYKQMNRSHLLLALDELDKIVRETGVKLQYSHLIFVGRRTWKDVTEATDILKKLNDDGFDVKFDMYPLDYGASIITVVLPDWYQAMSPEKRKNPFVKLKLAVMIKATTLLLGFNFSDITIAYAGENQKDVIGKTITDIAKARNQSSLNTYLDICEKSDFQAKVLMGSYQNKDIVSRLMQNEHSLYMTDAWVEKLGKQNGGIYGAFTKFLELAQEFHYPIEKAIAKMTGNTAGRFALKRRGLIKEGYFADINVIDLKALKNRMDEGLPPLGMEYVIINGTIVVQNSTLKQPVPAAGMAVRS
jgi:N-acyl-D-amino-acid deacylase